MEGSKRYSAKLLLFGEHTILRGSRALAQPLASYGCTWVRATGATTYTAQLRAFSEYLAAQLPDCFAIQQWQEDLAAGWHLHSTIPIGYGLGSSGSVCAAVFDRYATAQGQRQLRERGPKAFFAVMESHFHGASSGTDPLIIHEQQTLELFPDGTYAAVTIAPLPAPWRLFLLDTQTPRKTTTFVQYFLQRFEEEDDFRTMVNKEWISATHAAIDALKAGQITDFAEAFRRISRFQLDHLPPMVIPSVRDVWTQGLSSQAYSLKICGAGGGGCCLGLTADWPRTRELLSAWKLIVV
ncbi:MAG: hypothetical protein AAGJ82_15865 [Bacteroidota bacterium]